MKSALHSGAAKADLAAQIDKDKAAQKLQSESPLQSRRDIRGFWSQHPRTKDLFGAVMTIWRKSSARRPDCPGVWAAYPYPHWSEKTSLSVATLKRHLDRLEQYGLIERVRGRFGGSRVLTFIRPTELALKLSNVRPDDFRRIGVDPSKPPKVQELPQPVQTLAKPKKPEKPSLDEVQKILFENDPD